MKVPTIEMSPFAARMKWLEYRRAVKERHNKEDDALRRAYRELSLGRRVLSLCQVMRSAGRDERHRPQLAIARADWKFCFHWYDDGRPVFCVDRSWKHAWRIPKRWRYRLPISALGPRLQDANFERQLLVRAIVPTIPPAFRPAGNLAGYSILWDAEWETVPTDPILLRPINDDLHLVCAQWDLTPLEQAALYGKL